jgi:hypothetical protein
MREDSSSWTSSKKKKKQTAGKGGEMLSPIALSRQASKDKKSPVAGDKPKQSPGRLIWGKGSSHKKAVGPAHNLTCTVELGASMQPPTVEVTFDTAGQHTLRWNTDIIEVSNGDPRRDNDRFDLPQGSCNLYLYPIITTAQEPRGITASEAGVRILNR